MIAGHSRQKVTKNSEKTDLFDTCFSTLRKMQDALFTWNDNDITIT